MYTYQYSVGRYKNYQPGYHVVDINDVSLASLEKLFDVLYIVINDGFYNTQLSIKLEDYKLAFSKVPDLDIQEWLDTQTNVNLIKSDIIPGNKQEYVKLERIFTYGYFHYPADLNLANDRQSSLLADSSPDIKIAHYMYDNLDYSGMAKQTLFTVNGVFTRAVGRNDGIYLMSAGLDYIENRNDIRIGALSFEKLGNIETVPITSDILSEIETTSNKRWQVKTTQSLKNKTVWLVINGQLIPDYSMVYPVNDNTVNIDLTAFDVSNHYLTYKNYTRTPKLTNLTKFDKYKYDALLKDNTFIVIIDNPSLGIDVVPLTTFNYPNVLHTEEQFQHPILLENGLFPVPYIKTYGIRQRLLNHDLRTYRKYPFKTTGTLDNSFVLNEQINQGDPGHLCKGYLFKIHGLELKAVS